MPNFQPLSWALGVLKQRPAPHLLVLYISFWCWAPYREASKCFTPRPSNIFVFVRSLESWRVAVWIDASTRCQCVAFCLCTFLQTSFKMKHLAFWFTTFFWLLCCCWSSLSHSLCLFLLSMLVITDQATACWIHPQVCPLNFLWMSFVPSAFISNYRMVH